MADATPHIDELSTTFRARAGLPPRTAAAPSDAAEVEEIAAEVEEDLELEPETEDEPGAGTPEDA